MDREQADLHTLEKAQPFLNIDLGKRILDNLSDTVAKAAIIENTEAERLLTGAADLLSDVLQEARRSPRIAGYGLSHDATLISKLTGEERALAAEAIVAEIMAGDNIILDPKTNVYEVHSKNTLQATDKADLAFVQGLKNVVTGREELTVGTTMGRAGIINALAFSIARGPSDENPVFRSNIREEESVDSEGYVRRKRVEFSGGGKSPEEWSNEGFPIVSHTSQSTSLRNYLNSTVELRARWEGSVGILRHLLLPRTNSRT
jgi:hypothetical protein